MFKKQLPGPSELVQVTLPRPLGVIFEEDTRRGHVVVADFVPGSFGEQEIKARSALSRRLSCTASFVEVESEKPSDRTARPLTALRC